MDLKKSRKYFYYLISVSFLIIGLFGIKRLFPKADLPFNYFFQDNKIVASENYIKINPGDEIISVDDVKMQSLYQLETVLDSKSIGQIVELKIIPAGKSEFILQTGLIPYYRNYYFIIISILTGLSFWMTAVFLIMKKSEERSVKVLIWILLLFSLTTMTSPGRYYPGNDFVSYIVRASHVSSYFLGAIAFLYFTFIFPSIRFNKLKYFLAALYIVSIPFNIILISVQLLSVSGNTSEWVLIMDMLWDITEVALLISLFSGTVNLFLHYRKLNVTPERKKIDWIFWGLAAGVSPFMLLWLLPRLLGFHELIAEEFLLIFLILVPVFFAMAVIKYHVFEINVFIKKSLLYTSLSFITIIIYFISLSAITYFANEMMREYRNLVFIFLILMIAFIFNPLQIRLRAFIDKTFYRGSYNFEKVVSNFSAGIKNQNTVNALSRYVISEIAKIIPLKKIAIVETTENGDRLRILSHNNFDDLKESLPELKVSQFKTEPDKMLADKDKVEPGLGTDNSLSKTLNKLGINLVIPYVMVSGKNPGAVLFGDKLSELPYTKADTDILGVLISNSALAFNQLHLREKLIFEELKTTKLKELNEMMSYYVSSVSHDLKTPLTSIKMFTEILKEGKNMKIENANEYLDIIEGESNRLSRLINNVLNYTKIEKGIKEYSFSNFEIKNCIEDAIKIMDYQFMMENVKIEKSLGNNIFISADKDAVEEVLINLFSNALKYSLENKIIRISSAAENGYAVVKIEDNGIGISEEEIKNIFKPFVRLKNSKIRHTGGAGIGLSIVKNIMDAHKGKIEVESNIGEGSIFSLYFPVV